MANSYVLVLWLFLLVGLAVIGWGWSIIAAARRTERWPQVEGVIEQCDPISEEDDLLPYIVFSYTVNGQPQRSPLVFASGTTPNPEFAASYIQRYPVGTPVKVSYNPAKVDEATLEPGMRQGDWMVFGLGVVATIVAVASLIIGS